MDRRCLLTMVADFYQKLTPEKDQLPLCSDKRYRIPGNASIPEVIQYLETLPNDADPAILGLNENADISKELNEISQLLDGLRQAVPQQEGEGEVVKLGEGEVAKVGMREGSQEKDAMESKVDSALKSKMKEGALRDSKKAVSTTESDAAQIIEKQRLSVIANLLSMLPLDFNMDLAETKYPVVYEESMNVVLRQELLKYQKLLETIRSNLSDLDLAVRGFSTMTAELEQTLKSIQIGMVPTLWMEKSYPSLKPLNSYLLDLKKRFQFFRNWLDSGVPDVFWLSAFFFVQSFFTGILQNHARAHRIPIDRLTCTLEVTEFESFQDFSAEQLAEIKKSGTLLEGLYLEGARWDMENKMLAESSAKVVHEKLPLILIKPGVQANDNAERGLYPCPVYKTSDRQGTLSTTGHSTNFLCFLQLQTDVEPNHWIKRGVAALCQLDE